MPDDRKVKSEEKNNNMNAREKLNEFAEMTGMNKNQLIGGSIAADLP